MKLPDLLSNRFRVLFFHHFKRSEMHITWEDHFPSLSPERVRSEDHFWYTLLKEHSHTNLFNGTLCQLRAYDFSSTPIQLTLGPIQFKTHLYSMKKGMAVSENDPIPKMGLGVSVVVLTSDDQIVFMKRSENVAANRGQFDVFGGHIDPSTHQSYQRNGERIPDPFCAITAEIEEELDIKVDQIAALDGIGCITNRSTHQHELAFRCFVSIDADTLIHQAKNATDRVEYSHLIVIPNNTHKLRQICFNYVQDFSPSGLGSLWLHYMMICL